MIKIRFYTFNKKVNSTAQPSGTGTELDCNIKAPSSVINPVLEISADVLNYNYCYIPAFNRYYFIDDVVYNKGIWIVSCSVDVLASWKSAIGSSSCYVLRSSAAYDGDIIDGHYPAKSDADYQIITPALDPFTWSGFSGGVYVLGIKGNNPGSNGVVYYVMEPAEFDKLIKDFYNDSGAGWTSYWANINKGVANSLANVTDFISSCRWYPVSPSIVAGAQTILLGTYVSAGKGYQVADNPNVTYSASFSSIPKHPQAATRGAYLNCAPYSHYTLSSSFTGDIELDSALMAQKTSLNVLFNFDITTGQVKITVGDMFTCYGNFGIDISLAAVEVDARGILGNVAQVAGGLLTANLGAAIGGAAGLVGNFLDAANPAPKGNASVGGYIGFTQQIEIKCLFYPIVDEDNANNGRPYCKLTTPSTLTGYMVVNDPHVSINGTSIEANQINAYLAGGFYYE